MDESDRLYEWFLVYDFEFMLVFMKIKNIDNLEYIEYYMLILVSICFNVNGYIELYCIVELNVDDFIWKMILYMLMIE